MRKRRMSPRNLLIAAFVGLLPACGSDTATAPEAPPAAYTQPVWDWLNPIPHCSDHVAMTSLGENNLLLLTRDNLFQTRNGGVTWNRVAVEGLFLDLHKGNNVLSILAGDVVVLSTDGGAEWHYRSAHGVGVNPVALAFWDEMSGVVVGTHGGLATTHDGGITWTPRESNVDNNFSAVEFVDEHTLLAGRRSGALLRSTDGGATWSPLPFTANVLAIDATDDIIWVSDTAGYVYKSEDRGDSWLPRLLDKEFYSIDFLDASNGVLAGEDGTVFYTSDSGASWWVISNGLDDYEAATYVAPGEMWVGGEDGRLFRTWDYGLNWHAMHSGPRATFRDVMFATPEVGIAVGDVQIHNPAPLSTCGVYLTVNGGATWIAGRLGDSDIVCAGSDLNSVWMMDTMHAVAVGDGGGIWLTTDGGRTWSQRHAGTTNDLLDVAFFDAQNGVAVGEGGIKRHTDDGGATWLAGTSGTGTTQRITAIAFGGTANAIMVGDEGAVLASTDKGATWSPLTNGVAEELTDVAMLDEQTAVIVGAGGEEFPVLRTDDFGSSWEALTVGAAGSVKARVAFESTTRGYVVLNVGGVFVTDDGGRTWQRVVTPVRGANTICTLGHNTAVMAGSNGKILRGRFGAP